MFREHIGAWSRNTYDDLYRNTYDYDFEGNRTAKRAPDGALLASYTYDDKNRLVTVQQAGQTTTYTYDPFDYRIGMQHGGEQLLYSLDGEHIDAIYNVRGDPVATFLRGAVIDEIVGAYYYDTRGKKTFYTYSHDRLTSVASLADHTGAMVESYTYSPFGVLRSTTGGPTPNRLKYTGREQDPNGLYYYRARYYDPTTRRFLTEDPLGFAAGVNFYAYVGNNPVNANDPTGLREVYEFDVPVHAGAGAVLVGGFISTPSVVMGVIGRGDNRSYDPGETLSRSRIALELDFEAGRGRAIANDSGLSPLAPEWLAFPARPWNSEPGWDGMSGNQITLRSLSSGGVGIDIVSVNGAPFGGGFGNIDASFAFDVGPDGAVRGAAALEAYPAFEAYQVHPNGSTTPLLQRDQYSGAWYDPRPDVRVGLGRPQTTYPLGAGPSSNPYWKPLR